jgi:aminoglycoside phosphotransferase (APT) family kinase protein
VLAALHDVEPAEVGLDGLSRHGDYLGRQIRRWFAQYEAQHSAPIPQVPALYPTLLAEAPETDEVRIVHGDLRLDNCILDRAGDIAAVLDWEICTLGDPLADLGVLLVYWTGPDDAGTGWRGGATVAPGFWNRDQVAAAYAERSGRDLARLDYYVAFASWRLACVLEGVYSRYLAGALGERDPGEVRHLREQAEAAAAHAAALLGG